MRELLNTAALLAAVGLGAEAGFTIPGPFYSATLMPRYRLEFPYGGQKVRAISPWLGLGVGMVFPEVPKSKQFLMVALSAGLDFAVVTRDTFVGLQLERWS